jgi:hypothetical protein
MNHAENRSVSANAQRQSKNRYEAKSRALAQRPPSISKVLQHAFILQRNLLPNLEIFAGANVGQVVNHYCPN